MISDERKKAEEHTMNQHAYDKWKWIAENWNQGIYSEDNYYRLNKAVPQILQYRARCSFCEEFAGTFCIHCPLYKKYGGTCTLKINPYKQWFLSHYKKIHAEELRDAIFELAKKAGYNLT